MTHVPQEIYKECILFVKEGTHFVFSIRLAISPVLLNGT
jgi:hypothetical protein